MVTKFKEKENGVEIVRTRITAATNNMQITGPTRSEVASIEEINILLNMIVSDPNAKCGKIPKNADTPGVYRPPNYGQKEQFEQDEDRTTITDEENKFIEKAIGKFLYFARICDPTIIYAINKISREGNTQAALEKTRRLCDYLATNPNAQIVYKASDMILKGISDATFDSEPNSKSRYAGLLYFGNKNDEPTNTRPNFINGTISSWTKVHKHIVTSAAASEYGGLFHLAREAEVARDICLSINCPQPTTPLWTDNSTAIKLANKESSGKRSKTVARQHNWLAEQVERKIFYIHYESGKTILPNVFTKFLPVKEFQIYAKQLAIQTPSENKPQTQRTRRIA